MLIAYQHQCIRADMPQRAGKRISANEMNAQPSSCYRPQPGNQLQAHHFNPRTLSDFRLEVKPLSFRVLIFKVIKKSFPAHHASVGARPTRVNDERKQGTLDKR